MARPAAQEAVRAALTRRLVPAKLCEAAARRGFTKRGHSMFGLLRVIAGPDAGRTFSLVQGPPLVIGSGYGIEARLSDPQVGRVHCELQLQGDRVLLSDGGSASGTQINGAKATRHDAPA